MATPIGSNERDYQWMLDEQPAHLRALGERTGALRRANQTAPVPPDQRQLQDYGPVGRALHGLFQPVVDDYNALQPVSYTHLDVYKRQSMESWQSGLLHLL